MIKEVCIENFTDVPKLIKLGADRFELNNDLAAGGLTPSFGVMKKTIAYSHKHNVPVMVMIRPRAGDFVYSDDEIQMMQDDIQVASLLGADGVVFGCLTSENHLDKDAMSKLIILAKTLTLPVVMHMAFDEIAENEWSNTIDWLSTHGVTRILTHGGQLSEPIQKTILNLKKIMQLAEGKIEILPGGGINAANVDEIDDELHNDQYHGSKIIY
ncbi:copper homeostasis protein CutC [uncultured Lactobacillus sp.]|uniref:copper homeostasis protein CutC n=1 Tax=uncultured Lactobacillus sp. TaxID=153152 RepID=UPI0026239B4A|nr:copper homeostasis protein CutC [uncultured Lactobacillus sp.]